VTDTHPTPGAISPHQQEDFSMPPVSSARLAEEADYLEHVAAPRADAAALAGERYAADPAHGDRPRAVSRMAAHYARADAADYRAIAKDLRAGVIPDGFQI
jgi:hypothetical protein